MLHAYTYHMHTHIYIYIYVYVYTYIHACICIYISSQRFRDAFFQASESTINMHACMCKRQMRLSIRFLHIFPIKFMHLSMLKVCF